MRRARYVAVLAAVSGLATVLVGASSAAVPGIGQAVAKSHIRPAVSAAGLQFAAADGQDKTGCTGTLTVVGSTTTCTISQEEPSNVARCILRSDAADAIQICNITQLGEDNRAVVDQSIQSDGSTQLGQQIANVMQDSATGDGSTSNDVSVSQDVKQMTNSADTQKQDAFQSAVISQTAVGGGGNTSTVDQSQLQKAFGGVTQDQNSAFSLPSGFTDCATTFPFEPNACANLSQESDAGKNASHLKQSIDEDMNSAADASQVQGSFGGGLEGRVHQETNTGSSTNNADQSKRQKMNGGNGSFQLQVDPVRCCGTFSQLGGAGNSEKIDQHSALDASEPDANQESSLLGDSRSPSGSCSIRQHAKINTDTTTNDASISPCPFLSLATECILGFEEEDPGCTAFPPETSEIDFCVECIAAPRLAFARARP